MSPLNAVLIFVFVGIFTAVSSDQTAKDKVIAKTRQLITDFPTVEQTTRICDKLAEDAYNQKTIKDMAKGQ
ncbi:hypothetical protein AAVH_15826 [Aphelenchoides avenae]|nr:hypothetical protein AAVH_15826 [Aphelenchus avenae]